MAKKASLSPIGMHATYKTFDDFQEAYGLWRDAFYHPFTTQKSHKSPDPKIEYLKIKYSCVHRGTPVYRGTGQRPNQTYLGKNCPAFLSVRYFKTLGQYVVNGLNPEHNHETGPEIYLAYRQKRRMNDEERQRATLLLQSGTSADVVAKTMTQLSGKVISTKDIHNLRLRMKNANGLPGGSEEVSPPNDRSEEAEGQEPEDPDELPLGAETEVGEERLLPVPFIGKLRGRPRKRPIPEAEVASAVQFLVETAAAQSSRPRPGLVKTALGQIFEHRPNTAPARRNIIAHPLGTKLNLIKMHEDGSQDLRASSILDDSISGASPMKKVKIEAKKVVEPPRKSQAELRPQQIYVQNLPGSSSARGCSSFSVPNYSGTIKKTTTTFPAKPLVMSKKRDIVETLISGLVRVCPAQQLNTLGQVCKTWRERVRRAVIGRCQAGFLMEHGLLAEDGTVEAVFPALAEQLALATSLPRTALVFLSSAFFRPLFGPSDRLLQQTSGFEKLLPSAVSLCEIFGSGIVGSSCSGLARGQFQITQAQESNLVGGFSVLLWPEIRNADMVCLALDQNRLKEIEDSSYEMPGFMEAAFGDLPLKSLLFFEHGSPNSIVLEKIFDSLSAAYPTGFGFAGTEVCQYKTSPSIHTTENQWGPSLIVIGFAGEKVLSASLFLSDDVCCDPDGMATHLASWRESLQETVLAKVTKTQQFCLSFYCEKDKNGMPLQDDRNPNTLFAACFPDVPLLGIQSQGHVLGYSTEVNSEKKMFSDVLSARSRYCCAFTLVSVPLRP